MVLNLEGVKNRDRKFEMKRIENYKKLVYYMYDITCYLI